MYGSFTLKSIRVFISLLRASTGAGGQRLTRSQVFSVLPSMDDQQFKRWFESSRQYVTYEWSIRFEADSSYASH